MTASLFSKTLKRASSWQGLDCKCQCQGPFVWQMKTEQTLFEIGQVVFQLKYKLQRSDSKITEIFHALLGRNIFSG